MAKINRIVSKDPWSLLIDGARELGISITPDHVALFKKYLDELTAWNKKFNLTARTEAREIILKDFVDSLTVARYVDYGKRILDLGSGAGFPGVPLKILRPELTLVLLEANRRKFHFLRHIIRMLGLTNTEAHWTEDREALPPFDCVISRALGPLAKFAALATPHLGPGGVLIAMKGRSGEEEFSAALPELTGLGLAPVFIDNLRLPILGHERTIIGMRRAGQ